MIVGKLQRASRKNQARFRTFDFAGREGQWGPKEWQFFLKDLRRFMPPERFVHIKFNQYLGPGCRQGFNCQPVPSDLWDYFLSVGDTFDKRAMQISNTLSHLDVGRDALP